MKKRNLLNFNLLLLLVISSVSFSQTSNFQLQIKVFLEGPYLSDNEMTYALDPIPTIQPFDQEPWNYEGTEEVTTIPESVVDWVLVELRDKDDNTEVKSTRAGFLLKDGSVVDLDGSSSLSFNIAPDKYFIAVKHRSHLGIISNVVVDPNEVDCPATIAYDGRTYNTVLIGEQCWLKENLEVGTMILGSNDMTDNDDIEKYCYDDDPANCDNFGGLYQWNEAMQYSVKEGSQGICPDGWHIPTVVDYQQLMEVVNNSSNAIKLEGIGNGNGLGTNTSGFSSFLSGYFNGYNRSFYGINNSTTYLTSNYSLIRSNTFLILNINGINDNIRIYDEIWDDIDAASIRCLKGEANISPNQIEAIYPDSAAKYISLAPKLDWFTSDPNNDTLKYDVYFGTSTNPPLVQSDQSESFYQTTLLEDHTTYYWKIVAKDTYGNSTTSSKFSFTTSNGLACPGKEYIEYEGKKYPTVQIGNQCWLKENVDIGSILIEDESFSDNSIVEKKCYYDDILKCEKYGGKYSWQEAMRYLPTEGAQGICPEGWHIPSEYDFQVLENEVNNSGNKLKLKGIGEYLGVGTNESGFSAILGEEFHDNLNWYIDIWKSKKIYYQGNPHSIRLSYNSDLISNVEYNSLNSTYYVRCLENSNDLPSINLSVNSKNYSNNQWPELTYFEIEAEVTSNSSSSLENVELVYKSGIDGTYKVVQMTNTSGNTYSAEIPGEDVFEPNLYYYITASDGINIGFNPTNNVAQNPHVIEIYNQTPTEPQNNFPFFNQHNTALRPTLSWISTDPENNNLTYDIYFGANSNPSLITEGQTQNTFETNQLDPLINYYWKIVVKDDHNNISESPIWNFRTADAEGCPETVEFAGQTYNTVVIGDQCWFKENLNVGEKINGGTDMTDNSLLERYCYDNSLTKCSEDGALYQWNEAMQYETFEGAQGICPEGWHIPKYTEFERLKNFVNGDGNDLKEIGEGNYTTGKGTNSSGFSALLAGYRLIIRDEAFGYFFGDNTYGYIWSSKGGSNTAIRQGLTYSYEHIQLLSADKEYGHNIRCIMDNYKVIKTNIERTTNTTELHQRSWVEGTSFNIEADVVIDDNLSPETVSLFYKNNSSTGYETIPMINSFGNLYSAIIPGSNVNIPGTDYYIQASYNNQVTTDPEYNPELNPYQIAIVPNMAPTIIHTPVTSVIQGNDIYINAIISDQTNMVIGTELYYRKVGNLIYQKVIMTKTSENDYFGIIPASSVTTDGIEYYIYVYDDFGVGSLIGSADAPHVIIVN